MRATTASRSSVDVKPAAKLWPPPPWASAMRRTSTAERAQAHAERAVGVLLEHRRHLGLGRAPEHVDETLDLLHLDVVAA